MLHLSFLWHLHQPYYVDATRGTVDGRLLALMPWVRLHAAKGYLDMAAQVEQCPQLAVGFNLTPVLVRQILELAQGGVRDLWEHWTRTPAAELTPEQKKGILANFFSANLQHMIRPFPRYAQLLAKRGDKLPGADFDHLVAAFSSQELLDLQVWFNLTWCGYTACRLFPELTELKRKGRDFTEDEKLHVLARQHEILRMLLDRYRSLADTGRVELTTSPFFHPILPLVMDTQFARRSMPHANLPTRFSHPQDAQAQLAKARELHEQVFGRPPRGLWPPEGSVCPEMAGLLQTAKFEWFATDESILFRSLAAEGVSPADKLALFRAYYVESGTLPNGAAAARIAAVFRDRGLSDFIGFVASRNQPQQAVDFFMRSLQSISDSANRDDLLVSVILDGENAWEHFPDGGEEFLRRLYNAVTGAPWIKTTTISDYLAAHPPTRTLRKLHTGSWINADFDIWIGSAEENRAWELLEQTRRLVQQQAESGGTSESDLRAAMDAIYAAEGSDWFWWYGEDFVSEQRGSFDALFRAHLRQAYIKVGLRPPPSLELPICSRVEMRLLRQPSGLLEPVIDGQATSFFEWYQAGIFEPQTVGTMYWADRFVRKLYFGFNMQKLFFRVDFAAALPPTQKASLRLCFDRLQGGPTTTAFCVVVPDLRPTKGGVAELWRVDATGAFCPSGETAGRFALDKILELEIPWAAVNVQTGEQLGFYLQIVSDGIEVERYPSAGTLEMTLPDENFELRNWRV